MFTGIVEEVGRVLAIDFENPTAGLIVEAPEILAGAGPGDSIAVNGTCLTVTEHDGSRFSVGMMPETLRRTNLGDLIVGDSVNLERPVQPQSRLGGHFVQGHVDGTGTVVTTTPDGTAVMVRIEAPAAILRYIVEKGFVALDGASLTVVGVDDRGFSVALVPYTQEHVARGLFTPGHRVNVEVDILAKYLEKLVIH